MDRADHRLEAGQPAPAGSAALYRIRWIALAAIAALAVARAVAGPW